MPPISGGVVGLGACGHALAPRASRPCGHGRSDRLDDVHVAGAAADVPRDRPAHVVVGRGRVLLDERDADEHHPRRAEPALQTVLLLERGLDRMQRTVALQPFDGGDRSAVGLHREHRARLHRRAVEQHGARAAARGVAADVRAGEPGDGCGCSRRGARGARRRACGGAVDGDGDFTIPPLLLPCACSRPRWRAPGA